MQPVFCVTSHAACTLTSRRHAQQDAREETAAANHELIACSWSILWALSSDQRRPASCEAGVRRQARFSLKLFYWQWWADRVPSFGRMQSRGACGTAGSPSQHSRLSCNRRDSLHLQTVPLPATLRCLPSSSTSSSVSGSACGGSRANSRCARSRRRQELQSVAAAAGTAFSASATANGHETPPQTDAAMPMAVELRSVGVTVGEGGQRKQVRQLLTRPNDLHSSRKPLLRMVPRQCGHAAATLNHLPTHKCLMRWPSSRPSCLHLKLKLDCAGASGLPLRGAEGPAAHAAGP